MSQREAIVQAATAELGYIETGDNHTKFQKADQPWCGAFANWIFKAVKVSIPNCVSTIDGSNSFKKAKAWQDAESAAPLPGDLAFFSFDGKGIEHIGIVIKDNGDGTVTTIEGNTSPDKKGSQANGGEVALKVRAYKKKNRGKLTPSLPAFIVGFGKPTFTD